MREKVLIVFEREQFYDAKGVNLWLLVPQEGDMPLLVFSWILQEEGIAAKNCVPDIAI